MVINKCNFNLHLNIIRVISDYLSFSINLFKLLFNTDLRRILSGTYFENDETFVNEEYFKVCLITTSHSKIFYI